MQSDYKYSMNEWSQVITVVKFNCRAATQGSHHHIHVIYPTLSPNERRTSQPYGSGVREANSDRLRHAPACYPLLYGLHRS